MAQLCRYRNKLERLNVEVLLISFSQRDYAHAWSEETCPSFPILLDRERKTCRTYGLERSLRRSWNLKTAWSYVKLLRAGRKWRGIQGDSVQLGGDFIVDAGGICRLTYRSRDPSDRPSMEQLFAIREQLEVG